MTNRTERQISSAASADVVVAGHICLDIIPGLDAPVRIEPGRLVRTGPAALSTGGSVANTGLALFRLGVPVRLMGKIGDDLFGHSIINLLNGHNPALAEGMIIAPGEATSYSVVISPPGIDRSFLHCPGANDTFHADDADLDKLGGARVFHFGYPPIMRRMYEHDGEQLRLLFSRVRDTGLVTSLDLCQPDPQSPAGRINWERMLKNMLSLVDLFAPSIDELMFMIDPTRFETITSGKKIEEVIDHEYLDRLGDRLVQWGTAVCVIKLGDQGLYVHTAADGPGLQRFCRRLGLSVDAWQNRSFQVPCFRVERVAGTTGSGDSTIAGFIAALLKGLDPEQAARCATAVGAFSVEAPDATSGIPGWELVDQRLREGWPVCPSRIVRSLSESIYTT